MCFTRGVPRNLASLRAQMMTNQPEEAQMEAALAEMEEALSEDVVEYLGDHIQENLPESMQKSSPLHQEAWQVLRCRIQRPSVSACPEVQNPEESIWARALRQFLGFLQSLQQRCSDWLSLLRETTAAIPDALCSAVKAVWGVLTGLCPSVGQFFSEDSSRSSNPSCWSFLISCAYYDLRFILDKSISTRVFEEY